MTAQERWRRAYGYARASKRVMASWRDESLAEALEHERHARGRLPDNARKAVQP